MAARSPAKKAAKASAAPAKKATKASAPAKPKPAASTSRQSAKAPSKSPKKGASKAVSTPTKSSPKKAATPAAKSAPAKPPAKAPAKSPVKRSAAGAPEKSASKAPAKAPSKPAAKQVAKQPAKQAPAASAPAATATTVDGIPKPKFSKDGLGYTKDFDLHFVKAQFDMLQKERAHLTGQAHRLEAEAHQLVEEAEMGDVQFDDEGGEGDTMVVERERDLALSAQARDAVAEIDAALARITEGTYGYSTLSGRPIPKERLEAIPWSSVLVEEKVGGIGRR